MEQKKIDVIWVIVSIGSFALMSASFLLIPLDKTVEQYDAMDIIPGVMFWLFLILGITGQILLTIRRKRYMRTDRKKKIQEMKSRIGLLSLFTNIPAIVADVGFVISLIAFVIAIKATDGMGYICYILLAVCVFTICLHCIFNGKSFNYVIEQNKHLSRKREEKGNDKRKE